MKQVFSDKIDCEVTSLLRTHDDKVYVGTDENGLMAFNTTKDKQGNRSYAIQQQYVTKDIAIGDNVYTPTRHYGPFSFLHDDMGVAWVGYLFFGIDYTPYSN